MVTGIIFDIKKFSVHDGPGIRTTVFLKGCPLSCAWCHNPESQHAGPEMMLRPNRCIMCEACLAVCRVGAIFKNGQAVLTDQAQCIRCGLCAQTCFAEAREQIGREMTVAAIMADIERDRSFYDESGGGVTFSGGEPLLQAEFLLALLKRCQAIDIHTAVDTAGLAAWDTIDRLRPYVDLFLYDLKLVDPVRHKAFTGVSNSLILSNLQRLSELGHTINLRVAIIPGINDDDQNIRGMAEFAAQLPHLTHITLLPYHHAAIDKYIRLNKTYDITDIHPPSDERMAEITTALNSFGLQVKVGG